MTRTSHQGLTSGQYWMLVGMGIGAICLVVVNIFTATINAQVRREVNQRQQFINQSVKLGRLHGNLVQGLASLSAQSGDEDLRAALAKHGINFKVTGQTPEEVSDGIATDRARASEVQGGNGQ